MLLLNHITDGDGCDIVDGCRDRIYAPLVPSIRPRSNTGTACETCCCDSLASICAPGVDAETIRPWWHDGTDTMEHFYGLAADTVDYNTIPGGNGGTLTVFGRFWADNPSSLAKGMQAYRRRLDTNCGNCLNGTTLRVADHCPDACADGCQGWVNLHNLQLTAWSTVDDGTRTACVQPVVLTWTTRCDLGYRETCRGILKLDEGNQLECGLTICRTRPDDGCDPCATIVPPSPTRIYRGCWCRPVFRTAAGCRITPPAACGADVTMAFQIRSQKNVSNLQVKVWRSTLGAPGPWTNPGVDFYSSLTPAADYRIPYLDGFDSATVTPWDGPSRTCGGQTRRDGIEGALGAPITIPASKVGEELVIVIYGDTVQDLSTVELEWIAYEAVRL